MTASALTLLASQSVYAATATAPAHAPESSEPEKADTLVHSATKSLIESVGELSRTASKLSETALKLLEAQESLDERRAATGVKKQSSSNLNSKQTSNNAKSQEPLIEVAEEIISISNSITNPTEPVTADPIQAVQNQTTTTTIIEVIPGSTDDNISSDNLTSESKYEGSKVYISDEVTETSVTDASIWYLPEEVPEGGRYMWIPDADTAKVEAVLAGETISDKKIDLNEKVLWHGDSILLAIPTKRLGRFDRKLYNWLIYPKGLWHLGLTANYGELSTDDSEFLSLIQDVDLKGKIYSIKPSVSYFLRNNLCVGLRLAFTKGDMAINSFKVDIDEDMSFDLHDIKYTSDSYAAAVFIQQYFGLSRRGRFAVFNEAEVSIGTGSSHFIRPFDGQLRDTRTKTQTFNINYSPGVSIMMMKNAAFNLSFGIFGFHLKDEKQWENGEESGSRFTSGINFRFNLFNINFGVSIII